MTNPKSPREPVTKETPDLLSEQIEALRQIFPEAFSEDKVDFEKLRAALGDVVDERAERYSFSWAGKRDAIRLLQTPSRATLIPAPREGVNVAATQNLFIEGDNLEVLKLLYKPYFGRVKMIYIDPPYNTGNDFVYPDNYADPLKTYLELTQQIMSNPETSGRYHSAWLSMMYPRLFLARQLLREDGVIFVSIDDHEVHNLRMVMNEVFGEENFISQITVLTNPKGRVLSEHFAQTHDYLLVYARSSANSELSVAKTEDQITRDYPEIDGNRRYRLLELRNTHRQFGRHNRKNLFFPLYINPEDGTISLVRAKNLVEVKPIWDDGFEGCWTWDQKKVQKDNALLIGKQVNSRWKIFRKSYSTNESGEVTRKKMKTIWDDKGFQTEKGQGQFNDLIPGRLFQSPKPTELIKTMLQLSTNVDDIVLDFFAGSCTTVQAVLEQNREDGGNRRFIMVQLPEPIAGRGEAFAEASRNESASSAQMLRPYKTIADIGKERIRRVIAKMQKESAGKMDLQARATPEDLGFKVFKLAPSNYKQWAFAAPPQDKITPEAYAAQVAMFNDPLVDGWQLENVIYEVAVKEGYGLNCRVERVAKVTDAAVYRVTDPDKEQSFYLCLDDRVRLNALKPLELKRDDLFLCRDRALDDEAAANIALQCRLKTI